MNKTTTFALLSVLILCTLALMPAAAATRGNTLVTDCDACRVFEVDSDGNIVWEVNASHGLVYPFDADRLPNGNTLIADRGDSHADTRAVEVNSAGDIVWEITPDQVGTFNSVRINDADRLPNGNTLLTCSASSSVEVGVYEVDHDKNLVWYANAQTTPELYMPGGTTIQNGQGNRLSNGNTLIVCDNSHVSVVIEVDPAKNCIWFVNATTTPGWLKEPYDADRLSNGNTLISEIDLDTDVYRIIEVDYITKDVVWEVNQTTTPGLCCNMEADRLPGGNTLIVDYNAWNNPRIIEVDSAGNIVWELNEAIVEGTGAWETWWWIMDVDRIPPAIPADLTPTAITPNCGGYLFDGNNNEICALIENNGGFSSAFSVSIDINGDTQIVTVPELAAGENTTVCVTDSTIRNAGDTVTITVTADCNNEITEENETNNVLSSSETVVYNGYKGKRHTGGEDITTKNTFDLNGDLVYSAGDSYYLSAYYNPDWTTYDASWTDAELVIPTTATVVDARLYVPYTWDKAGVMSGVSLTFNTAAQTPYAHYADEKMYGTSYPYGMLAYDVTSDFDTAGNTANLINTHNGGGNVSMRGMMLVVVYEDATEPRRQIFVNEEFDLIYGGSNYCTTPAEATAWAPITGAAINPALTANARLITFAPGADGTGTAGEGELIFNGQTWNDEWTDNEVHQIGISDRDVTADLLSTGNEVGFQSNADWMEASNAILVVEENIFANNIYLVQEDSSASYGDTTTVEVYADTTDMHQGGQFYLTYPEGCANITDVTFDSMWPFVTKDLTTYPGAVFVTFRKGEPMVNGTQPICTLSVQCENPGYCQGAMHFALSGEVDASMISELYDASGNSLTDIGWHDGTFTCMNLPDLVVTEVYGEQQGTGDDYIVHYTVENQGNAAAAAGHTTSLSIGEFGGPYAGVDDQVVPDALAPGESYTGTFSTVVTMTIPNDEMKVCADAGSDVMELDENNNCETSIYPAGIELSVNVLDDGECVDFQEQFLVNINVDPRNIPVYGIQYVLSFDNSVLHAEWQNEGTFLNSDGEETTMYINTIDNGAGTISFAATRVGDVGGIANPSGTLAVIKFTASQQGASSTLTLSEVVAANDAGNEINPVDLINDEVCISANIAPVVIGESRDMYNNDGQKYICKVYFDGTASYDPDGAIVNWRWSFGDGNYGTGELKDHVYQSWNWNTETGEYEPFNVSLTVTDDGDPHQLDNTTFFEVMVYTAGDANADGKVNILDATIVGLEWGKTTTYGTRTDQADLNNDGTVNILDAVIIGTCWGHTAW